MLGRLNKHEAHVAHFFADFQKSTLRLQIQTANFLPNGFFTKFKELRKWNGKISASKQIFLNQTNKSKHTTAKLLKSEKNAII